MPKQTRVTSQDPLGRQAVSLFEAAYDQVGLDRSHAQHLIEVSGGFQQDLRKLIRELATPPLTGEFKWEELESAHHYPPCHKGPKSIEEQVRKIADIFGLDPTCALEYAQHLPELPEGAEGWFAIPSTDALTGRPFSYISFSSSEEISRWCSHLKEDLPRDRGKDLFPKVAGPVMRYRYGAWFICETLSCFFREVEDSAFNYHKAAKRLKLLPDTARALRQIAKAQKGDISIIAAQLGQRHRGRSVRRAREVFAKNEFGLGCAAVGAILINHPERFWRVGQDTPFEYLALDCAGDELDQRPGDKFPTTLCFSLVDVWNDLRLSGRSVDSAVRDSGSATGFLPE